MTRSSLTRYSRPGFRLQNLVFSFIGRNSSDQKVLANVALFSTQPSVQSPRSNSMPIGMGVLARVPAFMAW